MNRPLDDIVVVSLEQAIAAPMASRHLADWGARVIKLERGEEGDFARGYDQVMNGLSSQFVWVNRSKESLTIDIKTPQGQADLDVLLEGADVFIQNLAPGAAKRQGLDAQTLVARYPRLIACDISGYGSDGPYSQKKAYDLLVQCETGFLSINGTPETPSKCGIAIADIATGMYALNGILMALHQRDRNGKGMAFEVSLFDALTEWMSYPAYYTRGKGAPLKRSGAQHATIAPYGPFPTGDGATVFFGIQNEREWRSFCDIVLEDTKVATDPRFVSNPERLANRPALEAMIVQRFSDYKVDEVIGKLERAAIANGRMNDVDGLLNHPQVVARNRYRSVQTESGAHDMFLPPVTIPGMQAVMGPVPSVGQHTAAILAEIETRRVAKAGTTQQRLTRTILAVPGHRDEMVRKAAASSADAVFIDLEDAVPPEQKTQALHAAVIALNTLDWGRKMVLVRVNAGAGTFGVNTMELETLGSQAKRLDAILLPKVESAETVAMALKCVARVRPKAWPAVEMEALIETARGVAFVDAIAASPGLSALHFGVGDFSASIGARNTDIGGTHPGYAVTSAVASAVAEATETNTSATHRSTPLDLWSYPMMRILVAARAFGLRAIDGPCGAFRDPVLTHAWALKAAAMGYDGKQVIHLIQISPTLDAFKPSADELSSAQRTIAAMKEAEARGVAAISLDGKMVDYANVRMAKRIVAMAGGSE